MATRRAVVALLAAGLLAGSALGLALGWLVWPVTWFDTDPSDLRVPHQIDYVSMAADSFVLTADDEAARRRLYALVDEDTSWEQVANLVERVAVAQARDLEPVAAERIRALALAVELPSPGLQEYTFPEGSGPGLVMVLAALVLVAAVLTGLAIVDSRRKSVPQSAVAGLAETGAVASPEPPAGKLAKPAVVRAEPAWDPDDPLPEEYEVEPAGIAPAHNLAVVSGRWQSPAVVDGSDVPPDALGLFDAEYRQGNEELDCSFTIESPEGAFLGECGMGVANIVRFGSTRGVDAFEVWLFDKSDVRTVAQVLISEAATKNEALTARLSSKGDLLLVEPDMSFVLETLSLRVTVNMVGYGYVAGTPANAIFSHLAITMLAESGDSIP
ncbi:MAG: hypothetical protein ACYC5M_04960 [Anaerolineae bacterium]